MRKLLTVTLLLASLSLSARAGDTPIAGAPAPPPCQVDCPDQSGGQTNASEGDTTEPTEGTTIIATLADALVAIIVNTI